MDYIREFDIRLEKESYYAGETLAGIVILETIENFKVRAVRVILRGKGHTEWKVMVSGDRRTVKDDQYFIDDRATIWGKEKSEGTVPILPRGMHQFPFRFQLPESNLPCSFESRAGTIRYYIKVTVDIPYASPPQGMKYFTIIGPHIDCMDYLRPIRGEAKRNRCCLCCESGRVSLRTDFERSAYVCGESLRVKADIDNQSDEEARLKLRLVQYVEYYIDRGVLGVQKELSHTIMDYRGAPVVPHSRTKWDSQQNLVVPTMPPSLVGVCRLIQIYYLLKVNIELEKSGEDLHMHFPITIATVPFRIPNSKQQPVMSYDVASDHVEGGMYIGPEFLLGQVYDGTLECGESIVLYRPVYPTVKSKVLPTNMNNSSQPQSSASTPNATKGLKIDISKELPVLKPATNTTFATSTNSTEIPKASSSSRSKSSKENTNGNSNVTVLSSANTNINVDKDTKTSTTANSITTTAADVSRPQTTSTSSKKSTQPSTSVSSYGNGSRSGASGGIPSTHTYGTSTSIIKKTVSISIKTPSTSSNEKSDKDTEEIIKHVRKSSSSSPPKETKDITGDDKESKSDAMADKGNVNVKKSAPLPGRAVKLVLDGESSNTSIDKNIFEEDSSKVDLSHSKPINDEPPNV